MHATIFANERSKGMKQVDFKYISQVLASNYDHVEILMLRDFDDIAPLKTVVERSNLLVVVGGDGTVSFVVDAIMKYNRAAQLMVLPTGTMNDFAYSLGIDKKHVRDLTWYKDYREKSVDLMHVNDKYSTYLIGLGPFMTTFTEPSAQDKLRYGKLAYLIVGIKGLFRLKSFRYILNGEKDKAKIIVISNISSVGGFRRLFPILKVDDGMLNIMIIRRVNMLNAAAMIFMLFNNRLHQYKGVEMKSSLEFSLTSDELEYMDVDGDRQPFEALNVAVHPRALSVIVPK